VSGVKVGQSGKGDLPFAAEACDGYTWRWQIELFFKWIKQHLRIKAFFGTTENAVKTQIWIAVSVYVLVAIVKKRLQLSASLYEDQSRLRRDEALAGSWVSTPCPPESGPSASDLRGPDDRSGLSR
jgi:Transposase DDE domain